MYLVTGGTGFIGGHLLEKLRANGVPARCIVRRARPGTLPPGIETAEADWASGRGIEAALQDVDTVIHLAGVTKALATADYYTGNVRLTETLARLLAGRPVRFVAVSSLAAMGPTTGGAPLTEDDAPHPVSHYGKSKLEAERAAARWCPGAVIVRPPVVYGPRDRDVFQILKSIASGLVLEISGGERWFSAIYVEDLVDGLLAAARTPQAAGRTYFLAHPEIASWSELAAAAARIMGRRPRILRIPPAAARATAFGAEMWSRIIRRPGILSRDKVTEACCPAWTCDPGRAARELGFEAPTSLEAGLARTLAWYKEAGWIRY